jgi:hypothetical protein
MNYDLDGLLNPEPVVSRRIGRPYVPGNIAVISDRANRLKKDATLEELLALVFYMSKI